MTLRKKMILLIAVFLGCNGVALAVALIAAPKAAPADTSLPVLGQVPEFSFPCAQGGTVGLHDLEGKIWVADFFFTSCAGPCPVMSGKLEDLSKEFANDRRLQFVSYTVDGDTDTPEVLNAYAEKHHANPAQWHFLRPDADAVQKLAVEGFKVGSGDSILIHSTRFVLVDGKGQIRGYYIGTIDDDVATLKRDIRTLLKELSE